MTDVELDFYERDIPDYLRGYATTVPAPEARAVFGKAADEIERLRSAVALHSEDANDPGTCNHCSARFEWPCPTSRAASSGQR